MPMTIVRIYETPETAENVAAELKRQHFNPDDVHVVAGGESAAASIHAAGVPRDRAGHYAAALEGTRTALVVTPPFGAGAEAEDVMDQHGPVATPAVDHVHEGADFNDDATPFSRKMGWRVLMHNPEPFSSWLGWRTLSSKRFSLGEPALSANPAPLSSALGMPMLSSNPAPLSKATGMRELSDRATPLSDKFGWKTLSPKRFIMGDVKLMHEAAPFSRMLGLPVLSRHQ